MIFIDIKVQSSMSPSVSGEEVVGVDFAVICRLMGVAAVLLDISNVARLLLLDIAVILGQ